MRDNEGMKPVLAIIALLLCSCAPSAQAVTIRPTRDGDGCAYCCDRVPFTCRDAYRHAKCNACADRYAVANANADRHAHSHANTFADKHTCANRDTCTPLD